MPKKILIIDDEPDLCELVGMSLGREGYIVSSAVSAAEAFERLKKDKPDIILLDVMLPDMSGVELAGKLKNIPEFSSIPIILVTAKDKETDVVVGLNIGADDYVTKPFSTSVLTARIEAVLRRGRKSAKIDDILLCGPVKILPRNHQVLVDSQQVELTLAEYRILVALVEAREAVLSREELKRHLPDSNPNVADRVIDVHIASLRKKLGSAQDIIKTIHRLGYRAGK